MSKYLLIVLLVLCLLSTNVYAQTSEVKKTKEKSAIAGTVLGAAGFLGIFVPGTYGWGNFYAGDYTGWLILEIGGSACTICTWAEAIRLGNTKDPGEEIVAEDLSALAYIGVLGSFGFAVASTVWGGLSVANYNQRLQSKKSSVGFYIAPQKDGVKFQFCKRF
ncbi:hypothetical protein ES703_03068 [subsurface metagenome]